MEANTHIIKRLIRTNQMLKGMIANDSKMKADIRAMWQAEFEANERAIEEATTDYD